MNPLADSEAFRRLFSFQAPATVSQAAFSALMRMKSSLNRTSLATWKRTVPMVALSLRPAMATRPVRNVPS